ncbi:MAG: hypothetical protein JXR37_13970 [Kiritimatiellae bacterium]|nr:hypothetical protein [Kiritimatiellia bacterium]
MGQVREILYFDGHGCANTAETVQAAARRCRELGIEHVVVASDTGATALALWHELGETNARLVAVPEHAGYDGGDQPSISPEQRKDLEDKGIAVLVCAHVLSGVERSITKKFHGVSRVEIIAHTLRLFGGSGLKVAVEVAVMAADAGLVPTDRDIIAVGGSESGADTAVVLKAAHMNNFFDLEIREIIAKPRQRKEPGA